MERITKFIAEELKLISCFSKSTPVTIENGCLSILSKNSPKGFNIHTSPNTIMNFNVGDHVDLLIEREQLKLSISGYVNSIGFNSELGPGNTVEISVGKFHDQQLDEDNKYFCRTIIPINRKVNYWKIIDDITFSCEKYHRTGLMKVKIGTSIFHLFTIEKDNLNFLFIDCLERKNPKEFHEQSWSVIVALGYLIGHLIQGEEFSFYYKSKDFKNWYSYEYGILRDSIKTLYSPINANPYAWITNHKEAEEYDGKLKEINFEQFSNLCTLVYERDEIRAVLLLVLESMDASLLARPAGLSVALESLSEYFYRSNEHQFKPITEVALSKKIRKELLAVIGQYKVNSNIHTYSVLESRINDLNKPTNTSKLKAPFSVLNIPLSPLDEEVLMYRNDFLHGNITLKPDKKQKKKTYSMNIDEISLRLYTLINCIIMKKIGYNGYILNMAKIQEKGMKKHFDEAYYRVI